jgi:pilus assembly protein TadC
MMYAVIFVMLLGAGYMIMTAVVKFAGGEKRYFSSLDKPERPKRSIVTSPGFRNLSNMINRPFSRLGYFGVLQEKAGFLKLPFGALEIMLMKEFLMLGVGIFGFIMQGLLWAAVGAVLGFMLPDIILNTKVNAKKEAILRVFPEIVDILDLCIGAGLDFLSALRWVVEKSEPSPFVEQLEMVLGEISVGKSRTDALKDMAARIKLPDVNSFSRTIVQAERMGISIEEALRNLSEDTRNNRFQRGERYAIKAGLKMLIPLMLFILPVIMIVVAGPVIIQFTQGDLIPSSGVMQ